ncbi:hypothetical protein [Iningainema tapete]|uniref:Uncharacterized protein n=1 Tax=Iningainema tapete BLCC-T55 TaxID=2748662 RepID=A0A8J6XM62_9CYAN|nr:hypothetical protein [Iningainema tapete]MBD2775406.1 hypothetical protein [Iningainema tapete BLCC-T55]
MKKIISMRSKYLLICALAVVGLIFVNGYIQPTHGSMGNTEYNQSSENTISAELDTPFKLKFGQTVFIGSEELEIKFLKVTDSRCPANAFCIRQGEVKIELEILKDGDTIDNLILTSEVTNQKYLASADFDGYSVKLLRVDPYPGLAPKTTISDYVARLIVSKKAEEE